jgi:hypothetical protein
LLDRFPAFRKAVFNQYQGILVGGAAAFSLLLANPLPLIGLLGAELMTLPFLVDRLKRRIEIEKKHAARQVDEMSQEQQYEDLPAASKARFQRLRQLCDRIQSNYRGLSAASQSLLADQRAKFDSILASCLKRLWLLQKYGELTASTDLAGLRKEIGAIESSIQARGDNPRVRDALKKNLEIKRELERTLDKNAQNREALDHEIESLESLLELLLQKSVAATDAAAFSAEIDDVLHQVQSDAQSVEEMERMVGSFPALQRPQAARERRQ